MARRIVAERGAQDLIIGNNVLAHVPDINDFAAGLKIALAPRGTITMEFPSLLRMVNGSQFDTIYHEHFSYLSLTVVLRIFGQLGLRIYDVDEIPTHGGSLRVYACHADAGFAESKGVAKLLDLEKSASFDRLEGYRSFNDQVLRIRDQFLQFLLTAREEGRSVVGYGAAAKGNTLLNFCGVRGTDLLRFVVDRSPHKQGLYLPGSQIPVVPEEMLREHRPDYVVVLPWNLFDEVREQLAYISEWNGKLVRAVPNLDVSAAR